MNAETNPPANQLPPITPQQHERLAENWMRVVDDVARACHDAGRDPANVTIVGVTKYVDASLTAALNQLGCEHLGENRPQQLWKKAEALSAAGLSPQWHQIGQLQTNKVRRLLRHSPIIHTIDRPKLVDCIVEQSETVGDAPACLIEINISGDASKSGLALDHAVDFAVTTGLADLKSLRWVGLMGMSGRHADGTSARHQFSQLRELRDRMTSELGIPLGSLSMGMSGDFGEAIAEGATVVRIGSRLFEGLMP